MKEIKLLKWVLSVVLLLSMIGSARADTTLELIHQHEDFNRVLALAEKGDVKAQLCVATMYFAGWGTSRDLTEAFLWNKKASIGGSQAGKLAIGEAYLFGYGVFKDTKHARDIFHELVDRKYMGAASALGMMYQYGYGVPRDLEKAVAWYRKAASDNDGVAELQLGMMYKNGMGVKANMFLARQWLDKLPTHKPDCMPDFRVLINRIIFENIAVPKDKTKGKPLGSTTTASFLYHNGKAENPRIVQSSGYPVLDAAVLKAIRNSRFPPWPAGYGNLDKTFEFSLYRNTSTVQQTKNLKLFAESLRAVISRAVVLPKHVLVYGSEGTGSANVSFQYLDGRVGDVRITKSSGDKYEDAEAIRAVESAKYPPTPDLYKGQSINFEIPIDFGVYSPAPTTTTKGFSAAASTH